MANASALIFEAMDGLNWAGFYLMREGRLVVPDVGARAEVRRYLQGTGSVAGVVLLPAGHKKSFFQAAAEHLLPTGAMLLLLEAQAATCSLVDPATGRQLRVDEAVRAGLVGPELHRQLQVAEQAVTGYHDPFSGTRVPLFQAMKKELVDQPLALRLLDAQLANPAKPHNGRKFKIYYASQVDTAPCRIVLFCNDPELFHFSYKRYIENKLREAFGFEGVPIELLARKKEEG